MFTNKEIIMMAYGGYLILLSIITFFAYHLDKKKAEKGKWGVWRISSNASFPS